MTLALYGMIRNWNFYVRWRGMWWIRSGFCPCCYSSPPLEECPICQGYNLYGSTMPEKIKDDWKTEWIERCESWALKF